MAFINAIYNLWPDGDLRIPGLRDAIAKAAPTVFPKYGIDSNLLIAHLMAQGSLECGAGVEVEENLSYSAPLLAVSMLVLTMGCTSDQAADGFGSTALRCPEQYCMGAVVGLVF